MLFVTMSEKTDFKILITQCDSLEIKKFPSRFYGTVKARILIKLHDSSFYDGSLYLISASNGV